MKKKLLLFLAISLLTASPATTFADEKDDRIAELENQVKELEAENAKLQAMINALSVKSTDQDSYTLGETWVVEDQWKITVTSVEETNERNEFTDKQPAAVYILTYEYENLGYESDYMDGLYISLDDGIIDNVGKMGYSYPGDISMYPQETPVGATCEAQVCIGVDNAGSFKINFTTYDSNDNKQKAVFDISLS